MSENPSDLRWNVFTSEQVFRMQRAAYENGFREAQRLLLADLDKLRDPVTLHTQYQWLRNHFETLVTTAKMPKEPYNAEQIKKAT